MYNGKNYKTDGGDKWVIGGNLTFEESATVTGGTFTELTAATADTLGGVKVGEGLEIDAGGVLSVAQAENQAASEATKVSDLVADFNALLAALKAAGLMAADQAANV